MIDEPPVNTLEINRQFFSENTLFFKKKHNGRKIRVRYVLGFSWIILA